MAEFAANPGKGRLHRKSQNPFLGAWEAQGCVAAVFRTLGINRGLPMAHFGPIFGPPFRLKSIDLICGGLAERSDEFWQTLLFALKQ